MIQELAAGRPELAASVLLFVNHNNDHQKAKQMKQRMAAQGSAGVMPGMANAGSAAMTQGGPETMPGAMPQQPEGMPAVDVGV